MPTNQFIIIHCILGDYWYMIDFIFHPKPWGERTHHGMGETWILQDNLSRSCWLEQVQTHKRQHEWLFRAITAKTLFTAQVYFLSSSHIYSQNMDMYLPQSSRQPRSIHSKTESFIFPLKSPLVLMLWILLNGIIIHLKDIL